MIPLSVLVGFIKSNLRSGTCGGCTWSGLSVCCLLEQIITSLSTVVTSGKLSNCPGLPPQHFSLLLTQTNHNDGMELSKKVECGILEMECIISRRLSVYLARKFLLTKA